MFLFWIFLIFICSGRSYKESGHLQFTINSVKQSRALEKIENEFSIDWLAPHEGPNYDIGTEVAIITDPSEKVAITKVFFLY